jgi:hypothetical protein
MPQTNFKERRKINDSGYKIKKNDNNSKWTKVEKKTTMIWEKTFS